VVVKKPCGFAYHFTDYQHFTLQSGGIGISKKVFQFAIFRKTEGVDLRFSVKTTKGILRTCRHEKLFGFFTCNPCLFKLQHHPEVPFIWLQYRMENPRDCP